MPVRFVVSAPRPADHRYHVRAELPAGSSELCFPSWAPGSYLMREFARNVRGIHAHHQGAAIAVDRVSRNRWRVATEGPYTVEYDVYAREKSVRTPFLDEDLAFFLPSNLLVYSEAHRSEAHVVEIAIPAGRVGVCPLGAAVEGPEIGRWEAPDLDAFFDSPVSVGSFQHTSFEAAGVEHHHWIEPGHNGDVTRMNTDLKRIVETAAALFGGTLPYPRYDFVTLLLQRGHGGLEHKDGCILLRPRLSFRQPKDYEEFVTLAAHEHFHAWNVKRIFPDTLGPTFDYTREHYTRDLWWLEGGTVYYEERIAYRAGLVDKARHLERLCDLVKKVESIPGRGHQALEDGSFDAWIKLYRPGEDSVNSGVSYYLKGAIVVWALDLELLHRTDGRVGADDLLRQVWERWGSRGVGYPEREGLRSVARELLGEATGGWDRWWDAHIRGTEPIALAEALDHAGYELTWGAAKPGSWLGVDLADRLVVDAVREDGPSVAALTAGDEILAVNGLRTSSLSNLNERLKDIAPNTTIELLISRDAVIRTRTLSTRAHPPGEPKVVERADADTRQLRVRAAWSRIAGIGDAR